MKDKVKEELSISLKPHIEKQIRDEITIELIGSEYVISKNDIAKLIYNNLQSAKKGLQKKIWKLALMTAYYEVKIIVDERNEREALPDIVSTIKALSKRDPEDVLREEEEARKFHPRITQAEEENFLSNENVTLSEDESCGEESYNSHVDDSDDEGFEQI